MLTGGEVMSAMNDNFLFEISKDFLTGLPDRRYFRAMMDSIVAEGALSKQSDYAFLVIELDQFRMVNVMKGHDIGDKILQTVSRRLLECHDISSVARLGDAEFGILLQEKSSDAVNGIARRILGEMREPFHIGGQDIRLTASIGISLSSSWNHDVELAWRSAGLAVNRAKKQGGDQVQLYSEEWGERLQRSLLIEAHLSHAVNRQELELHYQPLVDLTKLSTSGLECLLRWNSPELGRVSPLEFIPIAEETGLIMEIGEWVLRETCRQCRAWQIEHQLYLPVKVNLSAKQFQDVLLAERIEGILSETGLSPEYLEVEITESMTLQKNQAIKALKRLKQIGLRIALDDFGTGYSSLSYLQKLPTDTIKIDQSFISDMETNRVHAAIVKTIIGLARILKKRIVAEGVESEQVVLILRKLQCYEAQGYYFSKPVAAEKVPAMVRMLDSGSYSKDDSFEAHG
ncbi:MAG: domain S-box protein [Paenibacillus sp.]|nr:domain S-box protein [Paenibacillus sp.]